MVRGPIEEQRIAAALETVIKAARAYALQRPHPFGALQDSIREAKSMGASCEEIAAVLARHNLEET